MRLEIPEHVSASLAKLQHERENKGLSKKELQKLTGVREEIITAYESGTGHPTRSKYNRLAEIFGWEAWK